MKLTEYILDKYQCDGVCFTFSETEEITKQILDNQEKAEKYDDLMNANSQVVKDNIALSEMQSKITELEKELYSTKTFLADAQYHTDKLDKQLQQYKSTIDEIEKYIDERIKTIEHIILEQQTTVNAHTISYEFQQLKSILDKLKETSNWE